MTDKWRPIATAPKEHGEAILACNPQFNYLGIVGWNGNDWESVDFMGLSLGIGFYPTHWLPLPKVSVD